jgi:Secretion system C-terminal sorting domain
MLIVLMSMLFVSNSFAQFTRNKVLINKDSFISIPTKWWASNVLTFDGKTYITNATSDSLVHYYISLNILDDTGTTVKHTRFRDSIFKYGIFTGKQNLIKTLDGNLAVVGVKFSRIGGYINKSYSLFIKLDKNFDTIFYKQYRNPQWFEDSVAPAFFNIVQSSIDSSYFCTGYAGTFIEPHDSMLIVKYDKNGNFLWDKIFKTGYLNYISTAWFSNNQLYLGCAKDDVFLPYTNDWWQLMHRYIIKLDTAGNIVNIHNFAEPSMFGSIIFNKFSDATYMCLGYCDTLNMPNPQLNTLYHTKLTLQISMLDSQNRFLWRRFIPMDTFADYTYRREHNPYFIGRTRDGGIICGGQKVDFTYQGAMDAIYRGWLMKLDSTGNILWNRSYGYGTPWESHYLSDFCEADNGDIIATGSIFFTDHQQAWYLRLDSMGKLSPTDSGFVGLPYTTWMVTYSYPNAISEAGVTSEENIQVYPNPVSNTMQISYNIKSNGKLILYDILGKKLMEQNISSNTNNTTIDVGNLVKGTYFLVCITKDKKYSVKLVKE